LYPLKAHPSMRRNAANTALTRMRLGRAKQVQSQMGLGIEQTASLSQVSISMLQAQADNGVIQNCHDVTGVSEGQAGGIFM